MKILGMGNEKGGKKDKKKAKKKKKEREDRKKKKEEERRNKTLEAEMEEAESKDAALNKLLLLGAGESGKSTLFKQMLMIYGDGFSLAEKKEYKPIIHRNIVSSIQILIDYADEFQDEQDWKDKDIKYGKAAKDARDVVIDLADDAELTTSIAEHIKTLWDDKAIKETYKRRNEFQLTDSTDYFLDRVLVVCKEDFVPAEADILRSRTRTTGIVENAFTIEGNKFKIFDVGGQRNERKKWIHCFENVTAVLFVVGMSEYNQVIDEDRKTNRMEEALNLFDEICNSRWFERTAMILFLNKRDLFQEKIKIFPLTAWTETFDGSDPHDYDQTVAFIKKEFESKNRDQSKHIYTHVCCATDQDNVKHMFGAVQDIIVSASVAGGFAGGME